MSDAARAVCLEYFGRNVTRAGRVQHVENRCDACPLRAPCLTWGAAPARNYAELAEARETFNTAAATLLGATT